MRRHATSTKTLRVMLAIAFAGTSFCLALTSSAEGAVAKRVFPVLERVGIVPIRWSAYLLPDARERKRLESEFRQDVRASGRFRVVGDDLVDELWDSLDGRRELVSAYELDAFVALDLVPRRDDLDIVMRLLDTRLEVLLREQVSVQGAKIADRKVMRAVLQNTFYALINRLPIDMRITSTQGEYLTFSGGSEQSVAVGQELSIVRPGVGAVHPADGSWTSFVDSPIGVAAVVEVKQTSSLARLTELTREGDIKIGDGVLLPWSPSRREFRTRQELEESFVPQTNSIVSARTHREGSVVRLAGPPVPLPEAPPAAAEDPARGGNSVFREMFGWAQSRRLTVGSDFWRIHGGNNAKSKFWRYVVNSGSAAFSGEVDDGTVAEVGANLGYGKTTHGKFTRLGAHAQVVQVNKAAESWPEGEYRLGIRPSFSYWYVTKEDPDSLTVIDIAGILAFAGGIEAETPLRWEAQVALTPLAFGAVNGNGGAKVIRGSKGSEYQVGVHTRDPVFHGARVGARFLYSTQTLRTNPKANHIDHTAISLTFDGEL